MSDFNEPEDAPELKPGSKAWKDAAALAAERLKAGVTGQVSAIAQVVLTLTADGRLEMRGNLPNWYLVIGMCEMGRVLADHQARAALSRNQPILLPHQVRRDHGL